MLIIFSLKMQFWGYGYDTHVVTYHFTIGKCDVRFMTQMHISAFENVGQTIKLSSLSLFCKTIYL